MKIKKQISVITLLSLTIMTISPIVTKPAFAAGVIITNTENENSLDKKQIKNIYLGKLKTFPNGDKVVPLDIATGDVTRAEFLDDVLGKSESNINSYWARMVFSSKGKPPKEMSSSLEVMNFVKANKSAIGYINATQVDKSVKVLMPFE